MAPPAGPVQGIVAEIKLAKKCAWTLAGLLRLCSVQSVQTL